MSDEDFTHEDLTADVEITSAVSVVLDQEPLTTDQARTLTHTIRDAAEVLWALIARAHAGKAWQALGYPSWEAYVRSEFNMSRSRSYQILDQARVIAAIETAVPEGTEFHVTEAAARDLKTVLEDAVPEIQERTAGLDPVEAGPVVEQVIAEQRERLQEARTPDQPAVAQPDSTPWSEGGTEDDDDVWDDDRDTVRELGANHSSPQPSQPSGPVPAAARTDLDVAKIRRNVNAAHDLYASLSALSELPDELDEIIEIIPAERQVQIDGQLQSAMDKLARFAALWKARTAAATDEDQDEE